MPVGPTPSGPRAFVPRGTGAHGSIYRCHRGSDHHHEAVSPYPRRIRPHADTRRGTGFGRAPGVIGAGDRDQSQGRGHRRRIDGFVGHRGGHGRGIRRPDAKRGGSRPVSRILSGPDGPDGHPSGAVVTDDLGAVYPRTRAGRPRTSAREPEGSLFDLAPGGVYLAARITPAAGGLLHHRFTLTTANGGGLLSVALSRGSPRVGVTDHPALWSPDFPRTRAERGSATVWPTPPPRVSLAPSNGRCR